MTAVAVAVAERRRRRRSPTAAAEPGAGSRPTRSAAAICLLGIIILVAIVGGHRRVLHRARPLGPTSPTAGRRPDAAGCRSWAAEPTGLAATAEAGATAEAEPPATDPTRPPRPRRDRPAMTADPSPERGRVAFLGLGTMGAAMAANLARAGFAVTAWNRTPGRAPELAELGVDDAPTRRPPRPPTPDIVVICVSDTPDVEAVLFGPDGVVDGRPRRARSSSTARRSPRRAAGTSPRASRERGLRDGRRARSRAAARAPGTRR